MHFSRKKLPKEAIQTLRRVPIGSCVADGILLTPFYIYLPTNQKFVAIKAPLQHFAEADLRKFAPYENFYLPEFIDQVAPFQKAGETVRSLLAVKQERPVRTNQAPELTVLPVPQHELDDAVLRLVGPLWGQGAKIEPFFLCFFADQVCHAIAVEKMREAVERNADLFELALLRASSAVFMALHIGYSDARTLTRLRDRAFEITINGDASSDPTSEMQQLARLAREFIPDADAKEISLAGIQKVLLAMPPEPALQRVLKKLRARLARVESEFIRPEAPIASLYGEKGIRDGT